MRHIVVNILFCGVTILSASFALGQPYPVKPIRMVTGPAGGGSDLRARQLAPEISQSLTQPVVIENRQTPLIAVEAASKAPADGYTFLVGGSSAWQTPLLQKTNYDVVNDFSSVSLLTREVFVILTHPSLPVKSVKELIALAKARPGELNFATGTTASTTHLALELLKSKAGVNILHVPYKGTPAGIAALLGGEVQVTMNEPSLMMPHVKSGKLRALAVTSATVSALAPGLPTVAASGAPGYEWVGMTHVLAPAKTPAAIINRISSEIVRVFSKAEVKERYLSIGAEVVGSSPEELAAIMKSDMALVAKLIKDAGIHVQ